MTFLERYKHEYFSRHTQFILFDISGCLIESCDSLFSTKPFANTLIPNWFLFMESIFESLKTLKVGQKITFSAVELQFPALPGIYDFDFSIHLPERKKMCCWVINDCTEQYKKYRKVQQERNELKINQEHLESEILKLRNSLKPSPKTPKTSKKRSSQER